ncbi:L,D-transpeptidase [Aeromicrobium sp. YIM 150415]|uniref:L,D-transpeptidase n=1 Tax=Aeromicrobium sp. YIM 150415 TaxID=2803912 RepID=UPI001962A606|nr:L,D-transpeptidase [Aeromicrobium sp. YIM 150415]MBM9463076.1 L,D-transpeptidase [Aeromicrobium sp. YIM 150415]
MGKHRRNSHRMRARGTMFFGSVTVSLAVGLTAILAPSSSAGDADETPALVRATLPVLAEEVAPPAEPQPEEPAAEDAVPAVPADSGEGRRVVFSQDDQRVWLVEDDDTVTSTYLVSGSRFDNLDPGSYEVRARYRNATSFDNSGTMEYFVEFTTGWSEPIGFHAIPIDHDGQLEQSLDQLGEALSAGCIRQNIEDAAFLWDWAPMGTPVIVV